MHIATCLATYAPESTLNSGYFHSLFVKSAEIPGKKSRVNLGYLIVLTMLLFILLFNIADI